MPIFEVFIKTRFFEKNVFSKMLFSSNEVKEMLSKQIGKKISKTRKFEENSFF
jgi:hypothetical protein